MDTMLSGISMLTMLAHPAKALFWIFPRDITTLAKEAGTNLLFSAAELAPNI